MHEINVLKIYVEGDKQILSVTVTKEFKDWFKSSFGLSKWNHMKFQRVFLDALQSVGLEYSDGKVKVTVL